jgi:hypothetical protein
MIELTENERLPKLRSIASHHFAISGLDISSLKSESWRSINVLDL